MYFLYFLILCYTSTSITPVNSYVVLAANLNDLRTIAKKFAHKDVVNEIKAIVLEKRNKYYRKPSKYDQQEDRIVEYDEPYDDSSYEDSFELAEGLRTAKQLKNLYKSKKAAEVAFVEPRKYKQVTKVARRMADITTLNDIVQKVKENLLKEFYESGNALGYKIADKKQLEDSQDYNNVPSKYATQAKVGQKKKPVYNSVPMKILKEEVQFEAYEDTDNQPQMQYSNYYKPIVKKSLGNSNNYPFIYATNTIPQSPQKNKKKVRFVKQVLAPVHSDQVQSVHVSQSNFVQQPSLDHQSNILQNSKLEPHLLSWRQESMDQPSLQQPNIAQQLALMQQQINELAKIMQANGLKKKTALGIEAIDAHFILPQKNVKENKTSENQKDHDETIEDTISEEIATEPVVNETSFIDLTAKGVVENEQFEEEYSVGSMKNEEEITEIDSNEELLDEPMHVVKVDNNVRKGFGKTHTQEFGNPYAGPPIVEKTYNFNAPKKVADDPNPY